MMTEEEAKKSFCPFMRDIVPIEVQGPQIGQKIPVGIVPANRYPDGRGTCCIGKFCMMWRWGDESQWKETKQKNADGEYTHTLNEPQGYCGLGGKP